MFGWPYFGVLMADLLMAGWANFGLLVAGLLV